MTVVGQTKLSGWHFSKFSSRRAWQPFPLRELGDDIWSYTESIFDGRHVYYGSERTNNGAHCRMLRFDTRESFKSKTSWEMFDASDVVGYPGSYVGLAFDGRYVYFAPFVAGAGLTVEAHRVTLRYDTTMPFSDRQAWLAFDLSAVDPDLRGFVGARHVNGSIYFSPYYSGKRSVFARYRCDRPFDDPSAWTVFDSMTKNEAAKGYMGVETDGRYVYFGPCYNDQTDSTTTLMIRHDTENEFSSSESWELFDLARANDNPYLGGYHGSMTFDGRYVYYSPLYAPKPCEIQTMHHGWLARFDTTSSFGNSTSWQTFDTRTIDNDVCGYSGAGFDGRFVYYCPVRCCSHLLHGRILRFDSQKEFHDRNSYQVFDVTQIDPGLVYFDGQIAFDGTYVYFPSASDKGIMLRFRTRSLLGRLHNFKTKIFS